MNIMKYKIDKKKWKSFIDKVNNCDLISAKIVMSQTTLDYLIDDSLVDIAFPSWHLGGGHYATYLCENLPISTDSKMGFGEVKIIGYKENNNCTRITIYSDGTRKTETGITEQVSVCID